VTFSFVVRLLDTDNNLLSWTKALGSPSRQDGGRASCPLWVTAPTSFVIEKTGEAAKLAVHWTDLDIARLRELDERVLVQQGQVFTFTWIEPIWLIAGMRDVPLPAVTVRNSVTIAPPPAQMGAKDPRVA
jgi:hypothetical protein